MTSTLRQPCSTGNARRFVTGFVVVQLLACHPGWVAAHEGGHQPLPNTGVTIDGDRLLVSADAAKAVGLEKAKVELKDIEQTVAANASLKVPLTRQALVSTLVPGRIEQVFVAPGDTVRAGQELARLTSPELETLQRDLARYATELALAQRMLAQRKELAAREVVAKKLLYEAQATYEQKQLQLQIAKQKLLALGLTEKMVSQALIGEPVRTLAIVSPLAGVVAAADLRAGQVVEPTEHLFHVVDLSTLWAVGEVLEADVKGVKPGLPVRVRFDAWRGKKFQGKVLYVGLKLDPSPWTLPVTVALDNSAGLLRAGMSARMHLQVWSIEEAVVCPADAVLTDEQGDYVLKAGDLPGHYVRRAVSLGQRMLKRVEVLDGLFPGDRVMTTGNHEFASLLGKRSPSPGRRASALRKPTMSPQPSADLASLPSVAEKGLKLDSLEAQGIVELPTSRKVFASTAMDGQIARVLVVEGQRVTAGQVLAEVTSLELTDLELELVAARVRRDLVRQTLERRQQVDQSRLLPQKERWQLEADLQGLETSVLEFRRKLALAGLTPDEIQRIENLDLSALDSGAESAQTLPVRAPADGSVAEFQLVPGQVVSRNQHLVEIHDLSQVWVQAWLREPQMAIIKPGQAASVRLVADPAFAAQGKVSRTGPVLSSGERLFSVWIELDNPDELLKEGMSARVTFDVVAPPGRKPTARAKVARPPGATTR